MNSIHNDLAELRDTQQKMRISIRLTNLYLKIPVSVEENKITMSQKEISEQFANRKGNTADIIYRAIANFVSIDSLFLYFSKIFNSQQEFETWLIKYNVIKK